MSQFWQHGVNPPNHQKAVLVKGKCNDVQAEPSPHLSLFLSRAQSGLKPETRVTAVLH